MSERSHGFSGREQDDPWSPDEITSLQDMCAKGVDYIEMQKTLGRSRGSLNGKMYRLGLSNNRGNGEWPEDDIEKLIALYNEGLSYPVIAEKLGKTRKAICGQVFRCREKGRLPRVLRAPTGGRKVTTHKTREFRIPTQPTAPRDRAGRLEYKRKVNRGEIVPRFSRSPIPTEDQYTPPEMRKSLLDLTDDQGRDLHLCKWPYGDGPFTFCGRASSDTYPSYCSYHAYVHFHGAWSAQRFYCQAAE